MIRKVYTLMIDGFLNTNMIDVEQLNLTKVIWCSVTVHYSYNEYNTLHGILEEHSEREIRILAKIRL